MVLFDCGTDDARYADAITAHLHGLTLTVFIKKTAFEGFSIFGAKLEYMADFNSSTQLQTPVAVRGGIARLHIPQVGDNRWLPDISTEVNASQVIAFIVRATNKIVHDCDAMIRKDGNIADTDRADVDSHDANVSKETVYVWIMLLQLA